MDQKRRKLMEEYQPNVEIFERNDMAISDGMTAPVYKKIEPKAQLMIGLPKNEDAVTKLLINKEDILRQRQ